MDDELSVTSIDSGKKAVTASVDIGTANSHIFEEGQLSGFISTHTPYTSKFQ
jgi:hypothetical protein